MGDPTGNRAGSGPLPPVTGTVVRMTGMAWIPRMDRSTDGWTNRNGRSNRWTDSRRSHSRWSSPRRPTCDRRCGDRWLGNRWLGNRRFGNGRFGNRRFGNGRFGNGRFGNGRFGRPTWCSVSRTGGKLTGGWRRRARAWQLRSTRLEPVRHCGTRVAPDATLDLVTIDVGPRAGTRCRRTRTTRSSCRKLSCRWATWSRRAADRWTLSRRWEARARASTGCRWTPTARPSRRKLSG